MALFRSIGAALDDDGTGTEPIDVRKGLAGLLSGPGVLPGAASPLVQGTDGFEYQVNAAHWVTSRGGSDGLHLWGNDGPITVPTDVAPGAGLSRIDIIYALHPSNGENADTTSEPLIGVAKGTAAAVPIAPTIPTGALELARNEMTSDATDTAGAGNTISQTAATAEIVSGTPSSVLLTPAGGWGSGSVRVSKMSGWVQLDVSIQRGSRSSTDTLVVLDSEYRPLWNITDGTAGSPGGAAPVQAFVNIDGTVSFAWGSEFSSESHIIRWSGSWPVGS